jgi:hypothetical protein
MKIKLTTIYVDDQEKALRFSVTFQPRDPSG